MKYLMRDGQGNLRCTSADEREKLLGLGPSHTLFALSAGEKKQNETYYQDKRLSLIGDSFSMLSFGWIGSQMCSSWVVPLSPAAIVGRFGLAPGAGLARDYKAPLSQLPRYGCISVAEVADHALVAQLSRFVNHTGSDVSISLGTPYSSKQGHHASLREGWWDWKALFRSKWKFRAHINALEMRMILQSIQWRARSPKSIGHRWLHLADSMVCNYILSKGRTSSRILQPLTQEISAHILALDAHQMMGHVDSLENPTDAASREEQDP